MHLVRDVLDKAIVDRNGREMGRVDRVILEVRSGSPPRVVAIEVGASALGARLGKTLGRCVEAIQHAFAVDRGQPLRMHVNQILGVTDKVKVDVAFGETAAANVEHTLRARVSAVPGASR